MDSKETPGTKADIYDMKGNKKPDMNTRIRKHIDELRERIKDRPEIPFGFLSYDELKTQLSSKYEQEENYIERTVIIEAEIRLVRRILDGLNSYQLCLHYIYGKQLTEQLNEDEKALIELIEPMIILSVYIEYEKYMLFLERLYEHHTGTCFHVSQEEIDKYADEQIEAYLEENGYPAQEIAVSNNAGGTEIPLKHVLKKFVEQKVQTPEQAETVSIFLDFIEDKFHYYEQDASDIRKTLNSKMEYMGQNGKTSGFKPLLDTKQAAELLGVSPGTIHNWIKKFPDLPFNKVGRKYSFDEDELRSWYYGKEVS